MARNWSDSEIDAIVRDYLDMLEREQTGRAYNKSEHRRALMEATGRSNGSVERKHMNVSAVMVALGLPHIEGYKPYRHFQRALFEAVGYHLREKPCLHALLTGQIDRSRLWVMESVSPSNIVFDDGPPPLGPPGEDLPADIRRIIRRFEPAAQRDARNRQLGTDGERLVYETERRRLCGIGRGDLSEQVRWVARDDGDGYGYDIRSFAGVGDEPERERLLEVKTTNGTRATPFFITRNELQVSRQCPDTFEIVRLYGFRRQVRAYRLTPPLERDVRLSPLSYSASF